MRRVSGEGSSTSRGTRSRIEGEDVGKYARYTPQQIEILENLYMECEKPTHNMRQEMIRTNRDLATLGSNQIKVWFQNRRSREKRRKVCDELQLANSQLTAANRVLADENDRLEKVVARLVSEIEYLRQNKTNASVLTGREFESAANSPQLCVEPADSAKRLIMLAEKTMTAFLSKETGSDVEWVQIQGMKTSPDSVQFISIARSCDGAAARLCSQVSLDPPQVVEILRDRSSWLQDCRQMRVISAFPARCQGIIELIYMQFYASSTLTSAHDFWTLRYTSTLEDGSLVVCEQSTDSGAASRTPDASDFQRARMLASGYLIQPCEGGGSIIRIVDHFDLETSTARGVLRPIYASSKLLAQRMAVAALRHIRQMAEEMEQAGKLTNNFGPFEKKPSNLRSFSKRLKRSYNDAINSFACDGWSLFSCDPTDNLAVLINTTKNYGTNMNSRNAHAMCGGVVCAKASVVVQNVSPVILVQFLKEHRSDWWNISVDAQSAPAINFGLLAFPGLYTNFSDNGALLDHSINEDEILEIFRLKGQSLCQNHLQPKDIYILQNGNGLGDFTVGAFSELIFAPIDEMLLDEAVLLSSGFRCTRQDINMRTSHSSGHSTSNNDSRAVLTVAFQFPFENNLLEIIGNMAQKYVCNVLSYVLKVAETMAPSGSNIRVTLEPTSRSPSIVALASRICQSYRLKFGEELLKFNCRDGFAVLKHLWFHRDAVLCFSIKSGPICIFANAEALHMLDATAEPCFQDIVLDPAIASLQGIMLDQLFGMSIQEGLHSVVRTVMQQGFTILPGGTCKSMKGHDVTYDAAVAWSVVVGMDTPDYLAFQFINWSLDELSSLVPQHS